jgi:hypothetical protein
LEVKKPGRTFKNLKLPAQIAAITKLISVKFKLDLQTNLPQSSTAVQLALRPGKKASLR